MTSHRLLNCMACQTEVRAGPSAVKTYCDDCRGPEKKRKAHDYYRRKNGKAQARREIIHRRADGRTYHSMFELLSTPESLEEGAYNRGAIFGRYEVAVGLRHGSFVPGTVFYDYSRKREWTVTFKPRSRYHRSDYMVLRAADGTEYLPRLGG